jgi:hypothetical protein
VPGEVGGANDPVGLLEVRNQVLSAPRVIAERDRVGAGAEDPVGQLRGEAGAVGGVLGVGDAEVRSELVLQSRQPVLERACPRRAKDVGNEEDLYGIASVAAGWTSMATWFPASCV